MQKIFQDFFIILDFTIDNIKQWNYNKLMNERNWGGKREGAGRKKGEVVYKTISISLPEDEMKVLQEAAKNQKMTVSRFISKYLGLDNFAKINKKNET